MHDCNNITCQLLNPSLNGLLDYRDLLKRVTKVEENFHNNIKNIRIGQTHSIETFPIDLWGWCNQHYVYQLPNLEFVQELAKTIKEIGPDIIVEIGAGRGIVCRNISKIIGQDIILTDDYSWWDNEENTEKIKCTDIIKMDYKEAIKKFKPDLIIASWIPYNKGWTKDFRLCPSVRGYIIIGEPRGGCTGSDNDWKTKWNVKTLKDVERYGICRTDHDLFYGTHILHTDVAYFERP